MNIVDFLKGFGASVASNNPATMLVDTAANVADLGRAAYGYLGHKSGMLKADQMPDPLERAGIPGSSEWINRQVGVNDSTESTVGNLAGMFVNPGKALNKVIIETRKLPGGEAAANKMASLKKMMETGTPQQRAKAKKAYELASKSQRTEYFSDIKDFMTNIPDDPKLVNMELFEKLRKGEVTDVKLSDLYDHRTLKKVVPKEFWDQTVVVSPYMAANSGAYGAGLNFIKVRKLPNGEYGVVTPNGLLNGSSGGVWSTPNKEHAMDEARQMAKREGYGNQGAILIGRGGTLKEDLTTFFHELQHSASTYYQGYKGGNPEYIGKQVAAYVNYANDIEDAKRSAKQASEMYEAMKRGLGFDDWAELNGIDQSVARGSRAYRLWNDLEEAASDNGTQSIKALLQGHNDVIQDLEKKAGTHLANIGVTSPDDLASLQYIRQVLNTNGEQQANKALSDLAFRLYERRFDEQLARSNATAAMEPWKGMQAEFKGASSLVIPNETKASFLSNPLDQRDPNLFFDPRAFD